MKKNVLILLMLMLILILGAEQYTVNANQNEVRVITSNSQKSVLEMTLGHFNREQVRINNDVYYTLNLKKEGITMQQGMPELPYITRSLIIPGSAKMKVSILESDYVDIVMPIAPSKGNLTRDIDPSTIPYAFDSFYNTAGRYPNELARLSEPFIIRDYRGITVHIQPFVYYPQTKTLRVYTRMSVSVDVVGNDDINVFTNARSTQNPHFDSLYRGLFLNYGTAKYPDMDEFGRILIINNSMFNAAIEPYVTWKRQKGYRVDIVDVTVAGPTSNQIKTYIQNQYNLNDDLTFVQIMGDHAQVPSLTSGGGASDPSFALLVGTDSYPEIFVGRFSATTVAELQTQIQRTIQYEKDITPGNAWLAKGMGIASNQGGGGQGDMGESDQAHMELIRTQLLGYGWTTVDQIYEAQGATQAQITTALNQGRVMINYVGHGSDTSWGTTGYSNTQVNQLTNDNMLPHVVSVACVNGNFSNMTCFAEAWLRATNNNNGAPTGALTFYGSSINQSWNPPMRAQDEIVDLMTGHQKNTIGGLYFNGSSKMVEVYGTDGGNMYKTWHIFGDASLQVRTAQAVAAFAQCPPIMLGMNSLTVQTNPGAWVSLYADGINYGNAIANSSGSAMITLSPVPQTIMDLTITVSGFNLATYQGIVQVLPSTGPYVVVTGLRVNDVNNQADAGETVNIDFTLNNVGSDPATTITATISTTSNLITILDNSESYGTINANASTTSNNGFSLSVASNVSDQSVAPIQIEIAQNGTVTWQYNMNLTLNAPSLSAGIMQINDTAGNNNGRIDPGETFLVTIPVANIGHASAGNALFSLTVTNDLNHIITPFLNDFPSIPANETASVMFEVTFSSQVPAGAQAQFLLTGIAGAYSVAQQYSAYIGLVMEDFESGTFNGFPWSFTGGNWTIDNSQAHTGANSAKSADIGNSGSTSMLVAMNVATTGSISYWKKVSSELSYDYLKFYVNNVLKNQWSGEIDWSQEVHNIAPGVTTFKWEYMKDYMVDSGSDCAWIDDILFPGGGTSSGTPVLEMNTTAIDFGTHQMDAFAPMSFTIQNSGDATLMGTITGNPWFKVAVTGSNDYVESLGFVIPQMTDVPGSLTFDVMFFPTEPGTQSALLTITSDDPNHLINTLPLTATAMPTGGEDHVVVVSTALKGNYPNPFNPETTIYYSLKNDDKVTVEIYNLLGQKVKTLVNGSRKAGNHSVVWNGRDDNGNNVGSGIYFYKMSAGKFSSSKKMILMK